MGFRVLDLNAALAELAAREPGVAAALAAIGPPSPRLRPRGHATLLRAIVGQQVSVAAASAIWRRLEERLGPEMDPAALLACDFEGLRACGLSRQKQDYARSLCALVASGELDLAALPADDEEAIALLTQVRGVGRWSAEIYLLFAEGRPDVWPAGDLGVQVGLQALLGLAERPSERQARALAEPWRPFRGAAAMLTWHIHDAKFTGVNPIKA